MRKTRRFPFCPPSGGAASAKPESTAPLTCKNGGSHKYENNRCIWCGKADTANLYGYLKDWVIAHGKVNGDYVSYSAYGDTYGGDPEDDFSLTFWNDSQKVEFCLHSVADDSFAFAYYLYVPKQFSGNYDYITSYYYRDTGESVMEAEGTLPGASFTDNYPLPCSRYSGDTELQTDFMEASRVQLCNLLDMIAGFLEKEQTGYTLKDIGFAKF